MILPACTRHNLKSVTMLCIARLVCSSKIIATLCLGLIALLGDCIIVRSTFSEDVRAFVDNLTHGAIGLLSWHIVTAHLRDLSLSMRVCQVVFCGLIASAVDLDHFAAARSLRIQDARQLSSRPPMHCTSIILAVFGLMLLLAHVFQWPSLHHFTWILVAAVVSHHLRDATRRGLWLYPFGSSPPIPYSGYLVGCMLLPHVVSSLMQRTQLAHHPATRPSIESFDKPMICMECCQSCKMAECNLIFGSCGDLEIFSVITGCLSLLMVVFLIVIVAHLSISLHKVKKQMSQKSDLDLHSAIQPNEEPAVQGFSMFGAQEDSKMAQKSRLDLHSYNNPAIQPNEEPAVRGFSMFGAQEDSKMAQKSRLDLHSYNNPAIQPNEKPAVRGFSMLNAQEDSKMAQKSRLNLHSYNNPAIQPNEELAVRGFSMYSAQADSRAPITSQKDDYPRKINPYFQPAADRASHMPEKDLYFGNFDSQPRKGRYAY